MIPIMQYNIKINNPTVKYKFKNKSPSPMKNRYRQQRVQTNKSQVKKLIITKRRQRASINIESEQCEMRKSSNGLPQSQQQLSQQERYNEKQNDIDVENVNRDQDTSSIISDLEYENIQEELQQKLIIKICDGVYIGGENSIWDVETMGANYITHLIRVESSGDRNGGGANAQNDRKQQKYVPEMITHLHVLSFDFNPQNKIHGLSQIFSKVCQFIQHAHEIGESCIIISCSSKTQQGDKQLSSRNMFQCVYRPAVIAIGYLMCRYSWGMLKGVQFVSGRLMAGQKINQTLQFMNSSVAGDNGRLLALHRQHQSRNSNSLSSVYSQLLAHMVPEVPCQNKMITNLEIWPDISSLPVSALNFLQLELTGMKNRFLTYGWNKNQVEEMSEEELVLMNTYLNSIMIGTENLCGNVGYSESNRWKSSSKQRYRNDEHRTSLKSWNNYGGRENTQQDRQLGILKSDRNRQLKYSKNKHTLSAGMIGMKNQNSTNISIVNRKRKDKKQGGKIINEVKRNGSCKRNQSNKRGRESIHKRVSWNQRIVESIHEYEGGVIGTNILSKRESRVSNFDDGIESAEMEVNRKLIRNRKNIIENRINEEEHNPHQLTSIQNPIQQKQNKKTSRTISTAMRNKIVVNVIGIIQNKNKNILGQNVNTHRTLINKKSSMNQSKAKLPTIHDILNEQNICNNRKEQWKQHDNEQKAEIFRCKTVSNMRYSNERQNVPESLQKNGEDGKGELLTKYLDIELNMVMSEGTQCTKTSISKILPVSKTTQITELSHESEELRSLRLQTESNSQEKQNSNKENVISQNQMLGQYHSPSQSLTHSQVQSSLSPKKVMTKSKIVDNTMNRLKQYKNSSSMKSCKTCSQMVVESGGKIEVKGIK